MERKGLNNKEIELLVELLAKANIQQREQIWDKLDRELKKQKPLKDTEGQY